MAGFRGEKKIFPMKRFELGPVALHEIEIEAVGASFAHNALQHCFRAGTPKLELDAVFLFECGGKVRHVFGHKRSVDVDFALFASAR